MNIFVLTGAGVSAESGLGTFRDKAGTGIWTHFDPISSPPPRHSRAIPLRCTRSTTCAAETCSTLNPTGPISPWSRWSRGWLTARGGDLFLCTQNVDDLHERAGSQQVIHMHGELLKARCVACATVH